MMSMRLIVVVAISASTVLGARLKLSRAAPHSDASSALSAGNCEFLDAQQGWQCQSVKQLTGGFQGNTYVVSLSSPGSEPFKAVLKEANTERGAKYEEALENLRNEISVAKHLTEKGFNKMPQYYFNVGMDSKYEAKHALLAMQFLDGWATLASLPQESARDRETRAAALFTAYEELRQAGVSHCDFNSGNAMFKLDDPCQAKIIDFGLARVGEAEVGKCSGKLPDLWDTSGRPGYLWRSLYMGYKNIDDSDSDDQYLRPATSRFGVPLATSDRNADSFLRLPFNKGMGMNLWKSGQGRRYADENWKLILQHAQKLLQQCSPDGKQAADSRPVKRAFDGPDRNEVHEDGKFHVAAPGKRRGLEMPEREDNHRNVQQHGHGPEDRKISAPSSASKQLHAVQSLEDARQHITPGVEVKYVVNGMVEFNGVVTWNRNSRKELTFGDDSQTVKIPITKFDRPPMPALSYMA